MSFVGPNTNKALLHAGHLRNIVLGDALTSARPPAFQLEHLVEGRPGPGWTIAEA